MRVHQHIWNYLCQPETIRFVGKGGVAAVLALCLSGPALSESTGTALARPECASNQVLEIGLSAAGHRHGVRPHPACVASIVPGIAKAGQPSRHPALRLAPRSGKSPIVYRRPLAARIPTPASQPLPRVHHQPPAGGGSKNTFPYGQCTWWADQRYFQLHGVYVPWQNGGANAWQWTARAYQFHWRVSSQPSVGAILDLQPGADGAYGLGHVAVVEKLLSGGRVLASTMNWGAAPWKVQYVVYASGPGVTFISQR